MKDATLRTFSVHTQCATAGTDEELMSLEAFDSDGSDNLDLVLDSHPSSECHLINLIFTFICIGVTGRLKL